MGDILFKMDDYVFSYRVAGVCIQNGCVLLQKPTNDDGYAFPGGHVEFGETNAETLIREFKEEIGADVRVGNLRWVAEVFFPWGEKPCHQICLYYDVEIVDDHTPRRGVFTAQEKLEGRNFTINFYWVPLKETEDLLIYPEQTKALLQMPADRVEHFIYKE
ncbi:MAG: NUDIX hydrolase [Clostridia bacterium]|nr:NUDIX hydrolase [Clostridia bacterium]MBQ4086962.1 NUDIX hydrolase [Clostridia bacterium]